MIRDITPEDAAQVCNIYNYYIENTPISFEENTISINEMQNRIEQVTTDYPWLVYEENHEILAYAYANRWKPRSAYRFTLESTIYASPNMPKGKGIGSKLYQQLFAELDQRYVRSVMAVIALPNDASVGLHEKMGFKKVAHFKEVGFKQDRWIDVGYWQRLLT